MSQAGNTVHHSQWIWRSAPPAVAVLSCQHSFAVQARATAAIASHTDSRMAKEIGDFGLVAAGCKL